MMDALTIRDSYELRRGCGYRQPGGIYLVGDLTGDACPLLPHALLACPACGGGVKPARGWTWVESDGLLSGVHRRLHGVGDHHVSCPLTEPGRLGERAGLVWVGEGFYPTPAMFMAEAMRLGVSRRLPAIPRGFMVGRDWVLLAHRSAVTRTDTELGEAWTEPGVFMVWRPTAMEYVVRGDETDEDLASLVARGCELVRVHQLGGQTDLSDMED